MSRLFIIFFLVSLFSFCTKDTQLSTPEDILIRDNEISGWSRTGNGWIANSSGDLNNAINGEAAIYTVRGFVEGAMQEYQGNVLENAEVIELRIFNQGSIENSKSIFDELVNNMSNPLDWPNGAGKEAKIDRISSLSQRILFYDSKYFISLSITNGIDEALEVLKTFAINIDTKIE